MGSPVGITVSLTNTSSASTEQFLSFNTSFHLVFWSKNWTAYLNPVRVLRVKGSRVWTGASWKSHG